MIYLVDEKYNKLDVNDENSQGKHFFEFNIKEGDFFLTQKPFWFKWENVNLYRFLIGEKTPVVIPEGMYIMIGEDDSSGSVDFVLAEEIINRTMNTVSFKHDFNPEDFRIESIQLMDVIEDQDLFLPNSKNLIPVFCGDKRVIMTSFKDCYHKMKHFSVDSIIA